MDRITRTQADAFVRHCVTVADTPAGRAQLRSALGRGPDTAHRVHNVIAPFTSDDDTEEQITPLYTVAALIGLSPNDAIPDETPGNLGNSLARSGLSTATSERHAHLLSRQTATGLPRHVTTVVRALRSGDTPVDFVQLLRDMGAWPWNSNRIAARWLRSYYRAELLTHNNDDDNDEEE